MTDRRMSDDELRRVLDCAYDLEDDGLGTAVEQAVDLGEWSVVVTVSSVRKVNHSYVLCVAGGPPWLPAYLVADCWEPEGWQSLPGRRLTLTGHGVVLQPPFRSGTGGLRWADRDRLAVPLPLRPVSEDSA